MFLSVKGFDGVVVDDVEDFVSLLREPVEEHVEPARHGGEHRVDVGIGRLFARILDHGADVPAAPDILGYDVGRGARETQMTAYGALGADVDGHARVLRQCLQKFHGLADRKKSCSALRRWGSRPGRIGP